MDAVSILICEDERLVALDVAHSLRDEGYKVTAITSSAAQVFESVHCVRPDLALLDINIQGSMSGIEVARVLQTEYDIPSIFLTAYADKETLEEVKKTTPLSFLRKPFDEKELSTAIELGLHRYRTFQSAIELSESGNYGHALADNIEQAVLLERAFMEAEVRDGFARVGRNLMARLAREVSDLQYEFQKCTVVEHRDALLQQQLATIEQMLRSLRGEISTTWKACSVPEMRTVPYSVEHLLIDVQELVETRFSPAVQCQRCPMDLDLWVSIDPLVLRSVLVEICSNAARAYGANGGMITLGASSHHQELAPPSNLSSCAGWYVVLELIDSARGMSVEAQSRVFEPGFSQTEGRGLGLIQAYLAARQLGGWIDIESAPGIGTKVAFYLPCLTAPEQRYSDKSISALSDVNPH